MLVSRCLCVWTICCQCGFPSHTLGSCVLCPWHPLLQAGPLISPWTGALRLLGLVVRVVSHQEVSERGVFRVASVLAVAAGAQVEGHCVSLSPPPRPFPPIVKRPH